MAQDEQKVVETFRGRYAYDRGLRRLKPLSHYQRLFAGFEDAIAREFARLESLAPSATAPPTPTTEQPRVSPRAEGASSPAATPPDDDRFGPYRILYEIGRGGQAVVYLAEDTRLPRRVALKVFATGLLASEQFLARFRREAEAASRLDHPGICTLYDAGVEGETPYIAMRYVEGRTLAEWIETSRVQGEDRPTSSLDLPIPAELSHAEKPSVVTRVAALVEKAARALHAAHEAGLIHRDVKPGNIIVTREGEPVLLDFGLAREDDQGQTLTVTGALLGTPAYMSPEQLLAQRVRLDCRTDVYSLGVTLYECLTLKRPFDAPTRDALYQQILTSDADPPRRVNPQIPRDLEIVLHTAMEKNRDRRYRTALEFAEDLRRLREHEPIRARPTPPLVRLSRWAQRNPALATGVGSTFALLAFGLAITAHFLARSRDEQIRTSRALTERTMALDEARRAREQAHAEMLEKAAHLKHARALALANASAASLSSDAERALLLAREAVRIERGPVAFNRLREAVFHCLESRALKGHQHLVLTAEFSPRGDRVVTASFDDTARVWDLAGTELAVLRGHEAPVVTAKFSPDGERILTASSDATARVWDVSGRELAVLRGHAAKVGAASFSPDGERIVTASVDRTARVWDRSGRELTVLRGHEDQVLAAAFSPRGDRIVTTSSDRTARVWDVAGGELAVLRGHEQQLRTVAFSPSGDRIVTGSDDKTARLWDLAGHELARLTGHEEVVAAVAFSPSGDRIVTVAPDNSARIWDLSGRELSVLAHDGWVTSVRFSPQGDRIVTGSYDSTARVWDLLGNELLALRGHGGTVNAAAFSPGGDRIVTASDDRTARVWDLRRKEFAALTGHRGQVHTATFSPAGDRIVTASADGTARVWTVAGEQTAVLAGHAGPVRSAAFSPDGVRVVTASYDRTARVWDAASGTELALLTGHEGQVDLASFSPQGDFVLTASSDEVEASDRSARLWDASTGRQLAVLRGHSGELYAAAFSPKGDRVLTAASADDKTARVWDLAGRETLALLGHTYQVNAASWSAQGDRILTASFDDTARVWDAASGKELAVMRGHAGWVWDASFSPSADRVVTASQDRTARVWDAGDGRQLATLKGHEGLVRVASFSRAGDRIVTASSDRTARLWDLEGRELAVLRGHAGKVSSAAFSPEGDRIVTASADGTALIWLASDEAVEKLAERRIGTREFTPAEMDRYRDLLGPEYGVVERHARDTICVFEVLERIAADPSLEEGVRSAALTVAKRRTDDPTRINKLTWPVVSAPGRPAADYLLAERRLEVAARLEPDDTYIINTFGVAQYRAGHYREALTTLLRSDSLNVQSKPPGLVEDVAFIAMCHHRLGDTVAARAALARLRERMKDARVTPTSDHPEILKETEELVGGD